MTLNEQVTKSAQVSCGSSVRGKKKNLKYYGTEKKEKSTRNKHQTHNRSSSRRGLSRTCASLPEMAFLYFIFIACLHIRFKWLREEFFCATTTTVLVVDQPWRGGQVTGSPAASLSSSSSAEGNINKINDQTMAKSEKGTRLDTSGRCDSSARECSCRGLSL